jgi:hypothetical protein
VHVPSEEKSEVSKGSFYGELELVSYHLPKDKMKILFGDVNARWRERLFSNRNWE